MQSSASGHKYTGLSNRQAFRYKSYKPRLFILPFTYHLQLITYTFIRAINKKIRYAFRTTDFSVIILTLLLSWHNERTDFPCYIYKR
jgi:hypothetical protein